MLKEKWFAKIPGFKQLKISLFACLPTRKLAYFSYSMALLICYILKPENPLKLNKYVKYQRLLAKYRAFRLEVSDGFNG